jgi:hypothetical protein
LDEIAIPSAQEKSPRLPTMRTFPAHDARKYADRPIEKQITPLFHAKNNQNINKLTPFLGFPSGPTITDHKRPPDPFVVKDRTNLM